MYKLLTFLIAAGFILPVSVHSQTDSELDSAKTYSVPSVTVTSTRAVDRVTPVPFSQMDKQEIERKYSVQDMPELLSELPSVISYSQNGNGIGYSSLTMRGFDQRRLSVMINGIPQNDPEDHSVYWIDFPDLASNLESIQVQRGAGILNYGSAAIGGSINLTTSNFVDRKGIRIYTGLGMQQYGASGSELFQPTVNKTSFEISSGLTGNYAFYGRLSQINSTGYRDNSWAKLNSYFLSAVRFDENFSTQVNIFGGPISDGLAYTGLPKEYINDKKLRRSNPAYWIYDTDGETVSWYTERRPQEIEEFSQPHFEILNDWFIDDNLTFKSSVFYYTGDGFFDYDGSWADTSMLRITSDNGFSPVGNPENTIIRAQVSNKHGGWIPRLIWKHNGGELLVGAEMRIHRSEHWGEIQYAANLPTDYDPDYKFYYNEGIRDIFSVYAREVWHATDRLNLHFESQLVWHRIGLTNDKAGNHYLTYTDTDGNTVGVDEQLFDINYLFFNPRLGANWNLDDEMNVYALAAYTSREPRMRNFYAADDTYFGAMPLFEGVRQTDGSYAFDFTKPLAKPESMIDIEFGWKYVSADYRANMNFYWMEYFDELVKSGKLDIFGSPVDGNAPKTRHIGAEFVAAARIFQNSFGKLELAANATFSTNEIIEYDFITDKGEKISLKGNDIAGFPSAMANVRLNYYLDDLYLSLLGKYVGSYRTDNFGDLLTSNQSLMEQMQADYNYGYYTDNTLDAYFLLNANLSYSIKNVMTIKEILLHIQANNLLNELYAAGAEGKEFFPGAERNIFFGIEFRF